MRWTIFTEKLQDSPKGKGKEKKTVEFLFFSFVFSSSQTFSLNINFIHYLSTEQPYTVYTYRPKISNSFRRLKHGKNQSIFHLRNIKRLCFSSVRESGQDSGSMRQKTSFRTDSRKEGGDPALRPPRRRRIHQKDIHTPRLLEGSRDGHAADTTNSRSVRGALCDCAEDERSNYARRQLEEFLSVVHKSAW